MTAKASHPPNGEGCDAEAHTKVPSAPGESAEFASTTGRSGELLISCLCITENRPQFIPWLLWCYDRQTWKNKELVIVDSSLEPLELLRSDVRVIHVPTGSGIMQKRGVAFQHMRGEALAWFDDDDWQHPERLERIAGALASGALMAGVGYLWLIDLIRGTCYRHLEPNGLLAFNAAGYAREHAAPAAAMLAAGSGVETDWSYWLQCRAGAKAALLSGPAQTALLCHTDNQANVPSRWRLEDPIEAFQAEASEAGWGDTGAQLEALRERLRKQPIPNRWSNTGEAPMTRDARSWNGGAWKRGSARQRR